MTQHIVKLVTPFSRIIIQFILHQTLCRNFSFFVPTCI